MMNEEMEGEMDWERRVRGSLLTKKLLVCEDLPHCKWYLGTCGPVRIFNNDVSSVLGARACGDGL